MLPITSYNDQIISAVKNHKFVIISAETGSGKSTQVPQFLSYYYSQVVVTEPRRMATKTLARRVSEEMGVALGNEVGYKTAYDKCASEDTKILYCTDGLQLIREIFNENNEAERVLIIDEIHEWNLNMETLLAWCKMQGENWNTKVVVMSATLDTSSLEKYLGEDAKTIKIPGTLFEVETEYRGLEWNPSQNIESYMRKNHILFYNWEERVLYASIIEQAFKGKNILVFVPGKKEITETIKALTDVGLNATILPLHGQMDWEEQSKCFSEYYNPKVIVATNVAQTSITIADIDVVIDSGLARVTRVFNGVEGLFLENVSKSDILQRRGRAGRTKNGKYILCSDTLVEEREENSTPEIQRSILDRVVLQLASIGLDATRMEFFHQPPTSALIKAREELNTLGAMHHNMVTEIGNKMVSIPVSVQLARMIVEAEKYGVVEEVLTISAIIEMGGLLAKDGRYFSFTNEYKSDLLAELDVWIALNSMGYIDFKKLKIRKKNFFLIKEHIKKLKEVLLGVVEISSNPNNRQGILKACISGLVSHIYVEQGEQFAGTDGISAKISKSSCIFCTWSKFVIGIPRTIEFKDKWGQRLSMNIITFASEVELETLRELLPDYFQEEESFSYDRYRDMVEVITRYTFGGIVYRSNLDYTRDHPAYEQLKEKAFNPRGEAIELDGKIYRVRRYRSDWPEVEIDIRTLFMTSKEEVVLGSGEKVWFRCSSRQSQSILTLRKIVEEDRINKLWEIFNVENAGKRINSIESAIRESKKLMPVKLTMDKGGFGPNPIMIYGCLEKLGKEVITAFVKSEEIAESRTLEAIKFIFIKSVKDRYDDKKFSHQKHFKKRGKNAFAGLTDSEREVKNNFYSLVREITDELTAENLEESLELVNDYFHELTD